MSKFSKTPEQGRIIDPHALRAELAYLFKEDNRFKMNTMDDPVEVLFVILNAFHAYSIDAHSLKYVVDKPCNPPCLSHKLFWINILEQQECECRATGEVLKYDFNYYIFEAYVKEILNFTSSLESPKSYQNKFFKIVKSLNSKSDQICLDCRSKMTKKNLYLLNASPYMFFNLVWRETNPLLTDICKLFIMLPLKLKNQELFQLSDNENSRSYDLFGLVCYWGSHYICFFKSDTIEGQWVSYDDNIVLKVASWKDLIIKCLKGHFHPTILFYKKSEPSNYSDLTAMKENLTDEEINKLMDYSRKFDLESHKPYKTEELDNHRLRPTSFDKKKTQMDLYDLSNRPKNSVENDEWGLLKDTEPVLNNIKNVEKDTTTVPSSNYYMNKEKPDELKEQLKKNPKLFKNSSDLVAPIKDDEWICENPVCKNVNKNTNYECLKCRKININIKDLIEQQHYYKSRINQVPSDNSKTQMRNSSAHIRKSYDKDDLLNLDKIICEFCSQPTNSIKLSCMNCGRYLQNKNLRSNHDSDKDMYSLEGDFSNKFKSSLVFNETKANWVCTSCKKFNKKDATFCSNCYKSKIHDTSKKDVTGDNITNNYSFNKSSNISNNNIKALDNHNRDSLTNTANMNSSSSKIKPIELNNNNNHKNNLHKNNLNNNIPTTTTTTTTTNKNQLIPSSLNKATFNNNVPSRPSINPENTTSFFKNWRCSNCKVHNSDSNLCFNCKEPRQQFNINNNNNNPSSSGNKLQMNSFNKTNSTIQYGNNYKLGSNYISSNSGNNLVRKGIETSTGTSSVSLSKPNKDIYSNTNNNNNNDPGLSSNKSSVLRPNSSYLGTSDRSKSVRKI